MMTTSRSLLFSFTALAAAFTLLLSIGTPRAQAGGLQESIDNASIILKDFQESGRRPFIPRRAFSKAKGVLIMKISKGGLGLSVTVGDGVLVARTLKGWSAPCAVSTSGAGLGLQGGGSVTEAVFLLMTDAAVTQFSRDSKVKFSGEMEAEAGPNEREVTTEYVFDAPVYVYSRVDGAFGGLSVQGRVFSVDRKDNFKYYGKPVTAVELLSGEVSPTRGAQRLLKLLEAHGG